MKGTEVLNQSSEVCLFKTAILGKIIQETSQDQRQCHPELGRLEAACHRPSTWLPTPRDAGTGRMEDAAIPPRDARQVGPSQSFSAATLRVGGPGEWQPL